MQSGMTAAGRRQRLVEVEQSGSASHVHPIVEEYARLQLTSKYQIMSANSTLALYSPSLSTLLYSRQLSSFLLDSHQLYSASRSTNSNCHCCLLYHQTFVSRFEYESESGTTTVPSFASARTRTLFLASMCSWRLQRLLAMEAY